MATLLPEFITALKSIFRSRAARRVEHQKGWQMVGEFADAIQAWEHREAGAPERLVKTLRALATFYPSHIWKEDYLLFPLAGRSPTAEDQRELTDKFEAVEHEIRHEVHERLEHLAEELEAEVSSAD